MATKSDKRHIDRRFPIARVEIDQMTFPPTASTAITETIKNVNGTIKSVEAVVADTEDGITYGFSIASANGAALVSDTGIADNSTHYYDSESSKSSPDANFNPAPVNGNLAITVTPSAAPDAGEVGNKIATFDLIIYLE